MRFIFQASVVLLATATSDVAARAVPGGNGAHKRSGYPLTKLVAFGDELSDNSNGSCAHGLTGGGNVYGHGTWTNGPVAVFYLADLLNVPLTDYAFDGSDGGGKGGAMINNKYTVPQSEWNGKPVPSVHDQIFSNYTNPSPSSIKTSLQCLWTCFSDLDHIDIYWPGDPKNPCSAPNISHRIIYNAERLIDDGAPAVFIPNIYPKELSPLTKTYLCSDGSCVGVYGQMIRDANAATKTALSMSKHADKLIYYDVNPFMVNLMDNKDEYRITYPLSDYCYGVPGVEKWDECIATPEKFF